MGDFNFHPTDSERDSVDPEFKDSLLQFTGGVESSTRPPMEGKKDLRYDYIFYKSRADCFTPIEVRIIGRFCIPSFSKEAIEDTSKDNVVRTPSDHYGVLAIFKAD